jgi:phospho-N-acetylmuramoyl-pentapeptide-transferase
VTDWFPFFCWAAWFLVAAAAASVATEWLIGWTSARGVLDRPNDRSSHTRATPRGGGISIVAVTAWAVILAAALWPEARLPLVALLVPALAIAAVSWLDDLKPLRNRVRFGVHLGAAVAATSLLGPVRVADCGSLGTFDLGFAAWPLTLLWIVGMTNAFNFMDGIDGIAGITAAVAGVAIAAAAGCVGSEPVAAVSLAFAGASIGFLTCNWPPARIFMGDVGSLSLGGALGMLAVMTKTELLSVIICGLFVVEALSVIAQTTSFKLTGKRVFRMAPIHHHFEKLGWQEPKIVVRFWIISIMLALVALASIKVR